jgi:hypothetical protein
MSARQRLMRRPSIHNTMFSGVMEETRQHRVSEPRGQHRAPKPPATELINRSARVTTPQRPVWEPLSPEKQLGAPPQRIGYESHYHRDTNPPTAKSFNHERHPIAPSSESEYEPRQRRTPNLPATQVVNRASPKKRKQPYEEPATQRVTRLQAKKSQESLSEQRETSEARSSAFHSAQPTEQTHSPRKKLKPSPIQQQPAQSKVASGQATQVVNRSLRKKKPNTAAGPSENTFIEPTQPATRSPKKANKTNATSSSSKKATSSPSKKISASPTKKITSSPAKKAIAKPPQPPPTTSSTKQKQLIVILPNRPTDTQIAHSDNDHMPTSAADRVKMSPRRAAQTSPCKVTPKPVSARAKKPTIAADEGSTGYGGRAITAEDNMRSSSRTVSPEKRAVPMRNDTTTRSPSAASSTMTRNRRVIPDISNYDEFKRLQAQGDLP